MSDDHGTRDEPVTGAKPGHVRSRTIFEGRVVHLTVDTVRFPDGSTGELEMIRHSGAAAVLPVLGSLGDADPEILLVRQYRYAADDYIFEVPAGRPDQIGEPWETCARRELEEETGLRARDVRPLTTIFTTPGFTDERIHLFLATGIEDGTTSRDPDEFIELERMPLSRALELIRTGSISDAKTLCTILYAATYLLARRTT